MERLSVPKCDHCKSDLVMIEVLTPNYDDGGGLETVEVDYVIDGCYTCRDEDELPF